LEHHNGEWRGEAANAAWFSSRCLTRQEASIDHVGRSYHVAIPVLTLLMCVGGVGRPTPSAGTASGDPRPTTGGGTAPAGSGDPRRARVLAQAFAGKRGVCRVFCWTYGLAVSFARPKIRLNSKTPIGPRFHPTETVSISMRDTLRVSE
jgi:hypothetical protein